MAEAPVSNGTESATLHFPPASGPPAGRTLFPATHLASDELRRTMVASASDCLLRGYSYEQRHGSEEGIQEEASEVLRRKARSEA